MAVERHLPLVYAAARRLMPRLPPWVEVDDVVQDGALGLLDAIARFDEARGVTFSTFAVPRILGAMLDAQRAMGAVQLNILRVHPSELPDDKIPASRIHHLARQRRWRDGRPQSV